LRFSANPIVPISLIVAALVFVLPSVAQQQTSPSDTDLPIEGILLRLQIHLWNYMANVPSFFCDEHVISDISQIRLTARSVANSGRTTTDSIFHLKRSDPGVVPVRLTEAREIKAVNNKPAQGEAITGPAIFSGAFSSGLNVVSLDLMPCYDYRVVPGQRLHHAPVLVIDYALKASVAANNNCPGPEAETGRAYIDPQTFQLLRIEMRTPNHELTPGSSTLTLWTWSVDYAPVTFDNKLFWMPKTIDSAVTANDGSTRWSFAATYRNYHKLNVTSRIVTPSDN